MRESRTKLASRNVVVGVLSKLVIMVFAFAAKTLFVRLLGDEYNGVNGLYSNILSILALSELGVGNVLNYTLYAALRQNDTGKVKALVCYFRKIYHGIALGISIIGLSLLPFLRFLVNSSLPQDALITYYLLYLANSVASYLAVYKTTVITADQNNYISSICETAAAIVMNSLQILYLLLRRDFLGYLIIQTACTVLKNVLLNVITNRKYPYLRHLHRTENVPEQAGKNQINDSIRSTFLYKIAAVILNHTDNILISVIVGTVFVGHYSNYYMIVSYITAFVGIFISGITASLGALNAENNSEASHRMFQILSLIFSFIGTAEVCCLLNCFQQFIPIWIGAEHVMDFSWVIVIALNLYLNTLMNPIWMFRETMGLFRQVRFLLLITAGLNIVFSVILGKLFGVPGILAATCIAKLVSQYWYEPKILFQKLGHSVKGFYQAQIKQVLIMLLAAAVSMGLLYFVGSSLICVFIRALVSLLVAVVCVYALNRNSEAMRQLSEGYLKPRLKAVSAKLNRRKS